MRSFRSFLPALLTLAFFGHGVGNGYAQSLTRVAAGAEPAGYYALADDAAFAYLGHASGDRFAVATQCATEQSAEAFVAATLQRAGLVADFADDWHASAATADGAQTLLRTLALGDDGPTGFVQLIRRTCGTDAGELELRVLVFGHQDVDTFLADLAVFEAGLAAPQPTTDYDAVYAAID